MRNILLTSVMMLSATVSWAQDKLTFVSPFPPGTGSEINIRILVAAWEKLHGSGAAVILNRPGGDGVIAARAALELAARGQPVIYAPAAGHMTTMPDEEYTKLTALIEMTKQPMAVIARKNFPANNWRELMSIADKQPGKVSMGLASGAVQAFAYEIERRNKVTFNKINYSTMGAGTLPTTTLSSNSIDLFVLPASIAFTESYTAVSKIVAITDTVRISGVEDNMFVAGDPKIGPWLIRTGLFVSKGMDLATKQALNARLIEIIKSPDVQNKWELKGITVVANRSVDEYQQYIIDSRTYWHKNKDAIMKDYQ